MVALSHERHPDTLRTATSAAFGFYRLKTSLDCDYWEMPASLQ